MMIKVSIIVPVYNVEKYLRKCLGSLIKQTLEEIEIIVVNDGTKDNSQVIIDEYAKQDKRIHSFIKENGGLSDARNYGIKKATGQYIGFVDSDDYVNYDMYEKLYQKAIAEDLDIVVCGTNVVFSEKSKNYQLSASTGYARDNIRNYIISQPMACTRLIKKELFSDDFLFKKDILYEDLCLMPTFAIKTKKIAFIEEALYNYFQRESSIMNQKKFNEKLNDIFKVLNIIKEKYIYDASYLEYKEEIDYLYITHLLRSASLRFIDYDNHEEMFSKIIEVIDDIVPNWQDNIYYKKSGFKFRTVCQLIYKRKYATIRLLKKISG